MTIYVTRAQVLAAQTLIDRGCIRPGIVKIAQAKKR